MHNILSHSTILSYSHSKKYRGGGRNYNLLNISNIYPFSRACTSLAEYDFVGEFSCQSGLIINEYKLINYTYEVKRLLCEVAILSLTLLSCYKDQISDLQSQIDELKSVHVAGVQSSIELMEKMDEQTKA